MKFVLFSMLLLSVLNTASVHAKQQDCFHPNECLLEKVSALVEQLSIDYNFSPIPEHPEGEDCFYDIGPYLKRCKVGVAPTSLLTGGARAPDGESCVVVGIFYESDYAKLVQDGIAQITIDNVPVYFVNDALGSCYQ